MRSTALTARAVADAVPRATIDYFYWPCIPGEDFPPTFNNAGAGYDSLGEYPAVGISNNVYANPTATWPELPLHSGTAKGWTADFQLNVPGVAAGCLFLFTIAAGPLAVGVSYNDSGVLAVTQVATPLSVGVGLVNEWHRISVSQDPAGVVTLAVDQAVIGTAAAINPTGHTLRPTLSTVGAGLVGGDITTLTISYP